MRPLLASGCDGSEAAALDIPHGRLTKEPAVLPVELAGAFIADFEGGAGGVQSLIQHALPGNMETQLLLVLQRAHGGKRTELMVERRDAHARGGGQLVHAERLGVVGSEPLDSLCGAVALLAQRSDGAEMLSLRASQQPEDDLALNQAAEERDVFRRVEQVDEATTCVEQLA